MNNITKQFHDVILQMVVSKNANNENEIDTIISEFSRLPMFNSNLTKDDIKEVRKEILSERSIKLNLGTLIEGYVKHEKWFLNRKADLEMRYWERYKMYLVGQKKFPSDVVNTMDTMLDTLTDLLGDPELDSSFQRRGLIIGDVQSGKTSNYTGLICKAVDAGYKVVVLLTGVIEKLRQQTQMRLDEGFVGIDSTAMINKKVNNVIGVGKYNSSFNPVVLTSTMNDFKAQTARNLGFNLATINEPVLFVIKKNVSTLKHLNKWLKTFNQSENDIIDNSILVIDDESDNASVNTNPEDRNPTTINFQIRELLSVFRKASYVGFTATPFANIFIDPESNDEMIKEDLFPKDYIYSLNSPTNYIGARNIFEDDGKHRGMLKEIDEDAIEIDIPSNHKSDFLVYSIPLDLIEAINVFLIANVIRDLRDDINVHRSMLINVSRFTNVQNQIERIVNNYLKDVQNAIRLYGCTNSQNEIINGIYNAFKRNYSELGYKWDDIKKNMYKSITPITIVTVNQSKKNALNYEECKTHGLRVIAIGGLSLSRGLTLEGLIVSYFYRNSKMYDTLMQMGRWFGYRKNYEDLCKIWMTPKSIEWYEHISLATDELRKDIKQYENSGLTPKDFGLRVRSDINALLVTARNKMRTASSVEVCVNLSGEVIETTNLFNDVDFNKQNSQAIQNMVIELLSNKKIVEQSGKNSYIFKNIDKKSVIKLLSEFKLPTINTVFNTEHIIEFINGYKGRELEKWDIAFASGESEKEFQIIGDKKIKRIKRSFSIENKGKILKMSGKNKRLGSSSDGKYGLTKEQIKHVQSCTEKKNVPQNYYFKYVDRNPLLMIYIVELNNCKNKDSESVDEIKNKFNKSKYPLVGIGVGIPKLKNNKTKLAKYTINKIQQDLTYEDEFGEEFGDEE
ncbi:Z1 domain-containing protein [Clostridium tarantellae]|uniref:Putative endonuclease Z1 domain-containing protein n=1 Tax=Clostridium tarantellae TaxID=39493 RepID=A0A6I1MPK9_9CLOT|nr:Z1 domain-containing protein [Clostridium tarantellae]MPQ44067.1 hypothetical protein [Clostridium tarantellae]